MKSVTNATSVKSQQSFESDLKVFLPVARELFLDRGGKTESAEIKVFAGIIPSLSPDQGTSTRRQRRDLFGLRIKLPPVTTSLRPRAGVNTALKIQRYSSQGEQKSPEGGGAKYFQGKQLPPYFPRLCFLRLQWLSHLLRTPISFSLQHCYVLQQQPVF